MELMRKRRIQESDLSTMIYIGSSSGGIVYNLLLVASTNYIASYDYSTVLDELRLVERVLTSSSVTAFLYDPLEDLLYYGMRSVKSLTRLSFAYFTILKHNCFASGSDSNMVSVPSEDARSRSQNHQLLRRPQRRRDVADLNRRVEAALGSVNVP